MRTNKDKQLLIHILEYCNRVEAAVKRIGTEEKLLTDTFHQDALAMPLAQIGELVRILSDEFKTAHGEIPWRKISGMREITSCMAMERLTGQKFGIPPYQIFPNSKRNARISITK